MVHPEAPAESVSELMREVSQEVRHLVTDEIALAKAEMKATAMRGLRAALGAALALIGTGVMAVFALVTLVEWRPDHALVAGLVAAAGLVSLLGGGLVIWINRRLWPFSQTKASLEEDLDWARRLSKRARP
ncbi:MAG: phage holin family protein [Candidatus Dormibacteria bacterium]